MDEHSDDANHADPLLTDACCLMAWHAIRSTSPLLRTAIVSTKYSYHPLCHLQMSLWSGRPGAPAWRNARPAPDAPELEAASLVYRAGVGALGPEQLSRLEEAGVGLIAPARPTVAFGLTAPPHAHRSVAFEGAARRAGPLHGTPRTILWRFDRPQHSFAIYTHVGGRDRRDHHTPGFWFTLSVITITGIGDHLRPEYPLTFTGIRMFATVAVKGSSFGRLAPRRGYLAGISSLQRRSTEPTQHGQR